MNTGKLQYSFLFSILSPQKARLACWTDSASRTEKSRDVFPQSYLSILRSLCEKIRSNRQETRVWTKTNKKAISAILVIVLHSVCFNLCWWDSSPIHTWGQTLLSTVSVHSVIMVRRLQDPIRKQPSSGWIALATIKFPYSSKINVCSAFNVHQNSLILKKQKMLWGWAVSRSLLQVFLMKKESKLMALSSPSHLCRPYKPQEEWQPSVKNTPQRHLFYHDYLTPCGVENEEHISPDLRLGLNWGQIKPLMKFKSGG